MSFMFLPFGMTPTITKPCLMRSRCTAWGMAAEIKDADRTPYGHRTFLGKAAAFPSHRIVGKGRPRLRRLLL